MTSTAPRRYLVPPDSIFHNSYFMLLWFAQFITQTAQQAIWFGMIIVVEDVSQSSVQLSVALLSTIIPGVLLGLIAGVVVDRSNKKRVLVVTNAMRAVVVLGYLLYTRSLYLVYVVNFFFVGVSQFFGPAEASTIPALVPKRQLISANSLFNLTFTISQLVGIVLLAPWIIKFFGASTLFIAVSVIYLVASGVTSMLPPGIKPERSLTSLQGQMLLHVARSELAEAWAFIRSDRRTWWAMIFATLASTLMLILAMLAPRYVVVEAGIRPEDSVFLFAPAGIGIFLMTLLMTRLATKFGELRLAYTGGIIFGLALVGMALLPSVWHDLGPLASHLRPGHPVPPRLGLIPPLIAISAIMGVGFALATIPSQSVLMERAPIQSRGRIFSVLLILGNVASILPLAFLGALADLYGVTTIVGVVGLLAMAITVIGIRERPDRDPVGPIADEAIDEPPVHLP